jgi:hypothetical protein
MTMTQEEVKVITDALDSSISKLGDTLSETVKAQLEESFDNAAKTFTPKPEDVITSKEVDAETKKAEDKAKMEAMGALSGITEFKVWDIPAGEALVGGFSAVFASEVIDGFLINQADWMKGAVKLAGAGAAVKWGGRLLGSTGSKALAILLAYDGIRSLIPIDTWARRGASAVTGALPVGGLGGFQPNAQNNMARAGSRDYYAGLYGGA